MSSIFATSGSVSGSPPTAPDGSKKKSKKRIRSFTPGDRACHRVIEKQRREALNESFLDLARLIPSLAPARRLSKALIVHESIAYLRSHRAMCIAATNGVKDLLAENNELLAEINSWRALYGGAGMTQRQAVPASNAILDLFKVETEVFGTFPGGFGDNGPGDEQDEDHWGENGTRGAEGDKEAFRSDSSRELVEIPDMNVAAIPNQIDSILPLNKPLQAQANLGSSNIPESTGTRDDFQSLPTVTGLPATIPDDHFLPLLDNEYGHTLDPYAESFTDMNVSQMIYSDFNMQPMDMGFYATPPVERSNLGYVP